MTVSISEWAPIALFIYKRPDHARAAIKHLKECEGFAESQCYVFADGAKHDRDVAGVREARAVARAELGDRAVYVERDTNLGVADAIIAGVTEVCARHGRVIVIEDDLLVSPAFLRFLNQGLQRYEAEPGVMQISGHMYDVPALRRHDEAIFLPVTTAWGWATWQRAWEHFDPNAHGWRELLRDDRTRDRFDLGRRFPYSKMLAQQMTGALQAWDIRWYYTVFAHGGLVLHPPRTLVLNVGLDGSGTHHRFATRTRQATLDPIGAVSLPPALTTSTDAEEVYDAIGRFRASHLDRAAALWSVMVRRPRRAEWGTRGLKVLL
ncbi:MAG: hypothetical protein QOJ59_1923 [Thermomicrobiales bacterium]|nr:hypothetical protein [Thermomicrobiales bacterium]